MALRCELVARKDHVAWKWAVVTNLMMEDVEITDMVTARAFAVYLTSAGRLLQCGERPRRVSYEKFLLRQGRRRSRAHAVGTQFKRLSMRERELQAGHVCDSTCCPLELPMVEKVRVLQVACGTTHCVVLCEVGDKDEKKYGLFAWGLGEYGQLGLGECQTASTMTLITASPELQLLLQNSDETHSLILRCGAFSTYLLSRGSSTLWHWGLLPSAEKDAPFVRQGVPAQFPLLGENTRLVDVAIGVEHVVLLSESGCVFTWGYGSSGQLGLGPSTTSNVDCEHPSQVDFFRQDTSHSIISISSGWNHTVAVSKRGEVYAWGCNSSGACGAKSKFCEYFQPVLVAVPRPVELGLVSLDLQSEVRCGGNTSTLLLFRGLKTTHVSIERAFKWGVGSADVGTLLPVEIFSFGVEQSKFARCSMGLESSMWLLRTDICSSEQETPLAWIVNEINARAASHQGIEEGLTCFQISVGAQICARVQAVTKTAAAAIENLSTSDAIDKNLFTLTLQHDDLVLTSDDQVDNDQPRVSILSVTRNNFDKRVQANSSVDIILLAQSIGKTIISLEGVTGEIIGGTFEVDVVPLSEEQAITMEQDENVNLAKEINILGIHVEGNMTESQERVDVNWFKLQSKRIRVHTDDDVIVLIESTTNALNPAVQVEFRNNQWQYGLTHLDVICGDGESCGQNLGVVKLRFPSPGEYFIYETNHHSEDDNDDRSPILIVSCCLAYQERHQIVTENHGIVWSKYQSALVKVPPVAQFSYFLSSILQHPALRDAVVCSPWTTTYDVERNVPPFDFDRENDAQSELLHHHESPFILWNPYVATTPALDNHERQPDKSEQSLGLNSILPEWAQLMASKVAFRIATWLEKPNVSTNEIPKNVPIDYEKARLKAAVAGLSVHQVPFDFLNSVYHPEQRAVREALAPANPNIMGVHDSIVSWRRTNGDLFYTVQSNDLRVKRYGHESHEFPETAQSGRITRLKAQLSEFLWQAAEGKKIEELFFLLATPIDPGTQQFDTASVSNVIHLRELIIHTTALGFDEVAAVLKQEWFALFRGIQALSSPDSAGITFCTLRTFLVDPFHQFFWKQYVHRVREQANSRREMVVFALVQSFGLGEGNADRVHRNNNDADCSGNANDGAISMIPWPDFVENLRSFHSILGLKPLPAPDCCRLLYRFDTFGNGNISMQAFQSTILLALDEIDAAIPAFKNSNKAQKDKSSKGKRPLKVAIANGHRRPNVELFTSSEAVHKLFAARAKSCPDSKSQSDSLSGNSKSTRTTTTTRVNDAAARLRASANTHLARIRNLPISHLLREGIYFRPPRKALYRCEDARDHTQAQTMGAEDSY